MSAPYSVKEIYFTLQGEGAQAGRAAVFCRFAGCNLWSGREEDRAGAICRFCDTEFVGTDGPGGGRFLDPSSLAREIAGRWPSPPGKDRRGAPLVVFTGGEPLLQLDGPLVEAVHREGFEAAVETNGTRPAPPGLDWTCVSPKSGAPLVLRAGDELKLVYPQAGAMPEQFEELAFSRFSLQPMDGPDAATTEENTRRAVAFCLEHPRWRLSIQAHKLLGLR